MLSVPEQLQKQLGEGLSIVATHDFPAKWENLLPELIQHLSSGNPATTLGVLQSTSSMPAVVTEPGPWSHTRQHSHQPAKPAETDVEDG